MTTSDPILAELVSSQSRLQNARDMLPTDASPVVVDDYREAAMVLSKLIGRRAMAVAIQNRAAGAVAS